MPATMNVHRLATFRDRLQPGSLFKLSGFDISQCNQNFRLSYSLMTIRFSDSTNRDVLTGTDSSIPEESFMIVPKLRFASWPTPTSVPDIDRFMFCLPFHSNISVTLSLFDSQAVSFHKKLEGFRGYPRVAVASSTNPKMDFCSRLPPRDHMYFSTRQLGYSILRCILVSKDIGNTHVPSLLRGYQSLFSVCGSEKFKMYDIEFGCTGMVHKEANIERSYPCVTCSNTNTVGVLRYRVEMSLADDTAEGLLVRFDGEMTKLHNMRAYEAGHLIAGEGVNPEDQPPSFIAAVVGKRYSFQVRVSRYNFTASHQTFTNENDRMHVPDFIAHVDGGRNERAETSIAVASLSGRHQETFGVKVFKGGQEAT
ncbi:unnamed protein product [Brassica oleracea var. botrytis]|uniref:Replication factor A C-terminal domain-containing protein n=2 Tax=Brassica TaxID=3705 RepID=A0A3P6DV52_BRAOL|nr:unnamed protein product [Brassica napus]VDD31580.1 unnamed protein product [Brassica oleracea]